MDLKQFNQIKEKLEDTESKICAAFGIFSCMQCSKCDQKISYLQILQFFDENNTVNKITCPLCQSPSMGITATGCDPGDEDEILEYYIQSIPSQISYLYKSKIECGINPYENDFCYSQGIVNLFITLESLISKIVAKKLKDEKALDDSITEYIVEKLRPNISDYIELLKICGFEDVGRNFEKLRSVGCIRNNVVHRGYKADFFDFASVYIEIGKVLVYLKTARKSNCFATVGWKNKREIRKK